MVMLLRSMLVAAVLPLTLREPLTAGDAAQVDRGRRRVAVDAHGATDAGEAAQVDAGRGRVAAHVMEPPTVVRLPRSMPVAAVFPSTIEAPPRW